ncbi:phage tail protein [Vibrio fortis]|uniref:phage tail protein n=1 Tax=Vibrio fortis TaxID=212667 RepID=UPI0036F3C191
MCEPFIGEIKLVPYNFAPAGWVFCHGQLLTISQNQALFALLGTTYGGDGFTTFGVPDLRGRVPLGEGQGPGLGHYHLGWRGGVETVTLSEHEMPAHSHAAILTSAEAAVPCSKEPGTSNVPGPTSVLAKGDVKKGRNDMGDANIYSENAPDTTLMHSPVAGSIAVENAGGSMPHENRQPYTVLNYVIATIGIFPARS